MTYEELLNDAITAMAKLLASAQQCDDGEYAIINPADFREFVDAHAILLYERRKLNEA
jgi:hypothetical protein